MVSQIEERKLTFINLNNHVFAEYCFIYRINDAYSIDKLSEFHGKHQLLFQKISRKNLQLNLMFVDSVFVNILADVVLEVFLNKVNSFNQYSKLENKIKLVDEKDEKRYFQYKFYSFIHMLLYSNITSNIIFNGNFFTDRVYCLKNKLGELEYFPIFEQSNLQLKLLDDLKLNIDCKSSSISKKEVKLHFNISYPTEQDS